MLIVHSSTLMAANPSPSQYITGTDLMQNAFFLSGEEWSNDREAGIFDYIIIGSSFCALAFVKKIISTCPQAKCLIVEGGTYFHQEHFQNLPPHFHMKTIGDTVETFPWKVTDKMHNGEYIKYLRGTINFFGGRSSFWSGWTPEPTPEDMDGWPDETKSAIRRYFEHAKELLNITPADEICQPQDGSKPIYGKLQRSLHNALDRLPKQDGERVIKDILPAPLAVGTKRNYK